MKTYKQFILEARPPKSDAAETIAKNLERKHKGNLIFKVSTTPGGVVVHNLYAKNKGEGTGTASMNTLHKFADRHGKSVRLTQSPEPGKERDLRRFYRRLGYKPVDELDGPYIRTPR
jgi:hypothetical protein